MREWARSHGHPDLSSRGRIPRGIVEEYEAAHGR
ncbi:MAG: Lsr2 family protein [Actinomycetota bacterium]|nr:Lsr2 family protein [Actinomycetota bacterium]